MNLADAVKDSLRSVMDPETKENVLEMGLIRGLSATRDGRVSLKLRPSSFHCPLAFKLAFDIYKAVETVEGVREIDLEVVDCVHAEEINESLKSGGV